MDNHSLYKQIVSTCDKCKGQGHKIISVVEVQLCDCMKFYSFAVKMNQLSVPLSYIFSFKNADIPQINKKQMIFFKDDQTAFNHFMSLAIENQMHLCDATRMYEIKDFETIDGLMVYNLGLETFPNNSLVLYRILKEIEDRRLYGIFSFAISKSNVKTTYAKYVADKVNESA